MCMLIKDQTVLITGASRGLGAEIAKAFSREGAFVVINYKQSKSKADELAEQLGNAISIQADVADAGQVHAMFELLKKNNKEITTVVHNALHNYRFDGEKRKKLNEINWEDFRDQIIVSQKGFLNILKEVVPNMEKIKFGRLVNIGTNLTQNPVVPYHDYVASKGGLLSLTKTAAVELGPKGITANTVSGGLLKITDASRETPDAIFDYIANATPLRRVTTPEELADAVLFFASPWARAITGQNLIVDGGLMMS